MTAKKIRKKSTQDSSIDISERVIWGKATYKNKFYYLLWDGTTSRGHYGVKLSFQDGSKTFWAKNPEEVKITARYSQACSIFGIREYKERVERIRKIYNIDPEDSSYRSEQIIQKSLKFYRK